MIGRLDPQKGFDLLSDAAPTLLERGARLVVQGSWPSRRWRDPFRALAAANPERIALIERFDRAMARRIYAGADFFAMPSRFEPCGQGQMIALRYGTPPIVQPDGRTGRHGRRRDRRTRDAGTGFVVRSARRSRGCVGACDAADRAARRAGGPRGRASSIAAWPSTSTGRPGRRRGTSRPTGGRSPSAAATGVSRGRVGARCVVSTGCVRCGACGAPGSVMTWSAPTSASNAAHAVVRHVAAGGRVRRGSARSGCRSPPGRRGPRDRRPSRRCRGGRPGPPSTSSWMSASALASTSPVDQAGLARRSARDRLGEVADPVAARRVAGHLRDARVGTAAGGSSRTSVAGRIPARGARPRSSRPSCDRRPGEPVGRARPPGSRRQRPPRCPRNR